MTTGPIAAAIRREARAFGAWLLGPSLNRRLVLAQALTMGLVWCAAIVFVAVDAARNDELLEPGWLARRADMVLSAAEHLPAGSPAFAEVLGRIDRFQRGESGVEDDPALRVLMHVWVDGRLAFRSPDSPRALPSAVDDHLHRLDIDGRTWRIYARSGPAGRARVILLQDAEVATNLSALGTGRILLLPLVLSLPFLIVAASLSVRSALRPWRALAAELQSRKPQELQPLGFVARHRELLPLTSAINGLLARLRDSAEREKSFIADAAHELRTPLAALQVHVEALQAPVGPERRAELMQGIARSVERARRLLVQLLSLMRRETRSGAPEPAVLSLTDLVQDRLAELTPIADLRDVELDLHQDGPALILADHEAAVSLVDNLVENAIKYAPEGSLVQVTIRNGSEHHVLVVDDQGPGIAPAYRERVLDRFFRIPDQLQSGSGLGLSIVEAVCVRHGARLHLQDGMRGCGLAAKVCWPAAPPEGAGRSG